MAQYAIEICCPRNENAIFNPLQRKLRGRWDMAKVSHRDKSEAMKELALAVPSIPGQYVAVHVEKAQGKVIDPLGLPEFKSTLDKCNEIFERYAGEFGRGGIRRPHPETTQVLDANALKTWLFCMRQLVDSGMATPAPGSDALPTLDDIRKMPGKRRIDPNYTGQHSLSTPDDGSRPYGLYPWADEVSAEASRRKEPAGAGT
jgi:hypothetical protein